MELAREHVRSIIFYNFRRGLPRQECIDELKSLFGNKAPSYSTLKNWFNVNDGLSKTGSLKLSKNGRFAKEH